MPLGMNESVYLYLIAMDNTSIYGNDDSFHLQYRSLKERISKNAHVLGSLENVWSGSTLLSEKQLPTLPIIAECGCSDIVLWMEFCIIA